MISPTVGQCSAIIILRKEGGEKSRQSVSVNETKVKAAKKEKKERRKESATAFNLGGAGLRKPETAHFTRRRRRRRRRCIAFSVPR